MAQPPLCGGVRLSSRCSEVFANLLGCVCALGVDVVSGVGGVVERGGEGGERVPCVGVLGCDALRDFSGGVAAGDGDAKELHGGFGVGPCEADTASWIGVDRGVRP